MTARLGEALRIANETVQRHDYDLGAVSPALKVVYLVDQLGFEVTTGGFLQWLTNRSGRYATETASALDEVEATRSAEIVRRVISFFPGGVPAEDDETRVRQIEELLSIGDSTWRSAGDDLLEWSDDIDVLLQNYVEKNLPVFESTKF